MPNCAMPSTEFISTLLSACLSGDPDAWVCLYTLLGSILMIKAGATPSFPLFNCAMDWEDVVLEVWADLRKNPEKLNRWDSSRGSFVSYVRAIARQLAQRACRRRRPRLAEKGELFWVCDPVLGIGWDFSIRQLRHILTRRENERLDELLIIGSTSQFSDVYRRKLDQHIRAKVYALA
jgi:hypothetical protein